MTSRRFIVQEIRYDIRSARTKDNYPYRTGIRDRGDADNHIRYDVIDYLKAEYPRKFIKDAFMLTDEQIDGDLCYIETHPIAVEEEYQEILRQAEETRQYWEERNREHFARIAAKPPCSGNEAASHQDYQAENGAGSKKEMIFLSGGTFRHSVE